MVSLERREALLSAAHQWRVYASSCMGGIGARAAEAAARTLEREAESGIALCACCFKPFGQHAGIIRS